MLHHMPGLGSHQAPVQIVIASLMMMVKVPAVVTPVSCKPTKFSCTSILSDENCSWKPISVASSTNIAYNTCKLSHSSVFDVKLHVP